MTSAHSETPLFLGIDLGTGGVRALAVSGSGALVAQASVAWDFPPQKLPTGWHEQPAEPWWAAVCRASHELVDAILAAGCHPEQLAAVAVDGTSGTVLALDAAGSPLRPAWMYNDSRAAQEAEELNALAGDFCTKLGYRFNASFALAKIRWFQQHEPALFARTARFVHQADYVLGRLSGEVGISDYSNALKTGYDLVDENWPTWLAHLEGVQKRLPRVVAPGAVVGSVTRGAAAETGLPEGLRVVAGASDGTAACLASGLRRRGDYNTTVGTTLVFKGRSDTICRHPQGLLYCHKLPDGWWLPGAASNTGGEWITQGFAGQDWTALDAAAADRLPNRHLAYPLVRRGERFPMAAPAAEGFWTPEPESREDRYAAGLQGVALLERLGYAVLDATLGTSGGEVYSTGGGSRSAVWMQCRASATGRVVHRPACAESAFGAAVLAAAGASGSSLATAAQTLVRMERSFYPEHALVARYDELYQQWTEQLTRRGYL